MRVVFATILLLFIATPLFAAEISVVGSQTIPPDEESVLDVLISTEVEMNAIEGVLLVPEGITVKSIRDGSSVISFWVVQPTVEGNKISFSGVIPGGFRGTDALLFQLVLLGESYGAAQLIFADLQAFANDGAGTAISIVADPVDISVLSNGTTTPVSGDFYPPEVFSVGVGSDENTFGGQNFAVFATQDKGSGVSYYEIQEQRTSSIDELAWVRAESPYVLVDQKLHSYIFVKAVDYAGNKRVVTLPPPRGSILPLYILYGIIAIIVVWYVARRIRKYVRNKRENEEYEDTYS